MDFVTIATTGNATDFGDMNGGKVVKWCMCSNETRGIYLVVRIPIIQQHLTILILLQLQPLGCTDFGDLT